MPIQALLATEAHSSVLSLSCTNTPQIVKILIETSQLALLSYQWKITIYKE